VTPTLKSPAELVFNTTTKVTSTGDGVETNATIAAQQLALWKAKDSSSLYNSPNDMIACVSSFSERCTKGEEC
jgi:hypothetical protein